MNLLATFRGSSSPSSRSSHSLSTEDWLDICCRIVFIFAKFFKNILCCIDSKTCHFKRPGFYFPLTSLVAFGATLPQGDEEQASPPCWKGLYIAWNLLLRCSRARLWQYIKNLLFLAIAVADKICLFLHSAASSEPVWDNLCPLEPFAWVVNNTKSSRIPEISFIWSNSAHFKLNKGGSSSRNTVDSSYQNQVN